MDNQLIIIGGMGPQASLRLHELIVTGSKKFHNGAPDSYPAILHVSIPVPDFIESEVKYSEALDLISQICLGLPLHQASAIGIACNTAHLMTAELPLKDVAFVSMIDAVSDVIVSRNIRKVGLLASPHTLRSGLYHQALQVRNVAVIEPSARDANDLSDIIHRVIEGSDLTKLRRRLSKIATCLETEGAEAILLGCTELPLVGIDSELPVVDCLQVLADAMLQKHYS